MPDYRPTLIAVVVLATCSLHPAPASATPHIDESKIIDLTYTFDEDTIYWPTADPLTIEPVAYGETDGGYFYASNNLCASEHGGTHMDAPIHFAEGQMTADEVPLSRCIGPACVIDVRQSCADDPDYQLTVADVKRWESEHGRLPAGAIVLMLTGWGQYWGDREQYFHTETPDDTATLHFPGYSQDVSRFLVEQRSIDAVGLDTPSLDYGQSRDFMAHRILNGANVPGFENVAQLEQLPPIGATFVAMPMKIGGGSGGPARIFAILPD